MCCELIDPSLNYWKYWISSTYSQSSIILWVQFFKQSCSLNERFGFLKGGLTYSEKHGRISGLYVPFCHLFILFGNLIVIIGHWLSRSNLSQWWILLSVSTILSTWLIHFLHYLREFSGSLYIMIISLFIPISHMWLWRSSYVRLLCKLLLLKLCYINIDFMIKSNEMIYMLHY